MATINEEAGLGSNWVPVDSQPIVPGRMAPPPPFTSVNPVGSRYLQGSSPSAFQHDVDFTDTETQTPNAPKFSLMPLGLAASAISGAAIQSIVKTIITPSTTVSGGLPSALGSAGFSATLANNASTTGTVNVAKTFTLEQVSATFACRIQLYATASARDTSPEPTRPVSVPPTPGLANQVICDFVLTGLPGVPLTFPCSPVIVGANQDPSPGSAIYWRLTNLSGSTNLIAVTLNYLQMEQ